MEPVLGLIYVFQKFEKSIETDKEPQVCDKRKQSDENWGDGFAASEQIGQSLFHLEMLTLVFERITINS